MRSGWSVLTLTEEDYDAVVALWAAAGLPIRPLGRDSRTQFAAQLAAGSQTVLGVKEGDRLVGVILATHDGRKGWLNRLAVYPDQRRQGMALFLIHEAERVLRAQGLQIIAALVEDWNSASMSLMARAGYTDHPDIHYLTKREDDNV